jgi:hypothetical protein
LLIGCKADEFFKKSFKKSVWKQNDSKEPAKREKATIYTKTAANRKQYKLLSVQERDLYSETMD